MFKWYFSQVTVGLLKKHFSVVLKVTESQYVGSVWRLWEFFFPKKILKLWEFLFMIDCITFHSIKFKKFFFTSTSVIIHVFALSTSVYYCLWRRSCLLSLAQFACTVQQYNKQWNICIEIEYFLTTLIIHYHIRIITINVWNIITKSVEVFILFDLKIYMSK